MLDFISQNSSALFTILGIMLGALTSFITAIILSRREIRLKLREKILDKRIDAHEKIIELSHSMRAMKLLGGYDEDGELSRTPAILLSKESYDIWHQYHYSTLSTTSNWLGENLIHELNLLQDYIVNLGQVLDQLNPDYYPEVGRLIRLDFIDFSGAIEKLAFNFFKDDLEKLRVSSLPDWHKYPKDETIRRLEKTQLAIKKEKLLSMGKT